MGIASDYGATAHAMLEHLLTSHPCAKQIARLPDKDIERLRGMLREAANNGTAPEDVHEAITQGFARVYGPLVASPPLTDDWAELSREVDRLREMA